MAIDKTKSAAIPHSGTDRHYRLQDTIDISVAANADVYQCLAIPAGTIVYSVWTKIVTPNNAGTSSEVTIGDGNGATSWGGTRSMKSQAGTIVKDIGGTDAYSTNNGVIYTNADTIDLTFAVTGTNTAGSVIVGADCMDLN